MSRWWETCLLSTFRAFNGDRAAIRWWIGWASRLGWLNWSTLSPDALLLVLTASDPGTTLRTRVLAALRTAPLISAAAGELYADWERGQVIDDIVAIGRAAPDLDRENLLITELFADVGAPLIRFLSRLYLIDMPVLYWASRRLVASAVRRLTSDYAGGFLCELYRLVLGRIPRPPTALPPSLPRWFTMISPEEQRFLRWSLSLPCRERVALFANVYGELDSETLASVSKGTDPRWTTALISRLLRRAWQLVFQAAEGDL